MTANITKVTAKQQDVLGQESAEPHGLCKSRQPRFVLRVPVMNSLCVGWGRGLRRPSQVHKDFGAALSASVTLELLKLFASPLHTHKRLVFTGRNKPAKPWGHV